MTWRSAAIGGGAILLCAVFFPGNWRLLWGLLLGFAFSILKFCLSCSHLIVFANKIPPQAHGYLVQRRFVVYALTAAVLAIAFWRGDIFNGWATVGGLFLTNAVLIADTIRGRRCAPVSSASAEDK